MTTTFATYLNEMKSGDVDSIAKKLAKLTDRNNHTEAALELAKFLGATKYVKILKCVQDIQNIERSLPFQLGEYRNQLLKEMKSLLEQNYDKETVDKIWGSL